jgi:protein TonB
MKKITSIVIFLIVGIFLSAQTDSTKSIHKDSTAHAFAEEMPVFNGTQDGFMEYLKNNIKYPPGARKDGKQGTVYVKFIVERNGSISDIQVVKSSGTEELDNEAIRVLNEMPPNWTPGKMNGKAVRVTLTQPVKFALGY